MGLFVTPEVTDFDLDLAQGGVCTLTCNCRLPAFTNVERGKDQSASKWRLALRSADNSQDGGLCRFPSGVRVLEEVPRSAVFLDSRVS